MITKDDFNKVEMRAGKILSAKPIEGSEKLLKLLVDFGPTSADGFGGTKQVLSGIAKYVKPEELAGVTCTFVTNLEPKKILDLESQAMIMAVSGDNFFSLLKLSQDVPPGTVVK